VDPYEEGLLDVGDGHRVYWCTSGNPRGMPAVALHGGPGGGLGPGLRRRFDAERYRLVQFDQRGCGRSTPHAGVMTAEGTVGDLGTNTTHHLVADIEALRHHLGVERWLVWGASWGVTLALAYAERFPERVTAMVLLSVTLTRPQDVHWFGHTVGRYLPEAWARLRDGVPATERDGDLVAAYDRLLNGPASREQRLRAARDWAAWEDALLAHEPGHAAPSAAWADERYLLGFTRLVTHYFSHAAWLDPAELLGNAPRLAGIPGVVLHGRLDLAGPADLAWELARAWPGSQLHVVAGGHTGDAEMEARMVDALDRFALRPPG
jgi:proline iminopeptidase